MITQEYLKSVLEYNQYTGVFTWTKQTGSRTKIGGTPGTRHPGGYLRLNLCRKMYYAHRLAWLYMTGEFPENEIDHINMDKMDNRWCNLRVCSHAQNNQHKRQLKNNTSGCKGVYWSKVMNKWNPHIEVNKKKYNLGYFEDFELAVFVRHEAAIKYHMEFNSNEI